jgi:hypothetical protein
MDFVVADGNESNCIIGDYFVTPQRVILNSFKHCGDSTDHLVQHSETLNFANSVQPCVWFSQFFWNSINRLVVAFET